MRFVLTPTEEWLLREIEDCTVRFMVASPYVTGDTLTKIAHSIQSVPKKLVTSTNLDSFARGSSSFPTVLKLAESGVHVASVVGLHAKVYVVDNAALVTSANATYNGMHRNYECGVELRDEQHVNELARIVENGFGGDVETWTAMSLKGLESKIEALKPFYEKATTRSSAPDEPAPKLPTGSGEALLGSFGGWQRLVLECVLSMPSETFTRKELLAICLPIAKNQFADAKTPEQTTSRVLQELRNLGLVEFIDNFGNYRRLTS